MTAIHSKPPWKSPCINILRYWQLRWCVLHKSIWQLWYCLAVFYVCLLYLCWINIAWVLSLNPILLTYLKYEYGARSESGFACYSHFYVMWCPLAMERKDCAPLLIITDRITDIHSCVSCDMAFIKPMHRNKPNVTYDEFCSVEDFTTEADKSRPSFHADHIVCHRQYKRYRYMWKLISQLILARMGYASSLIPSRFVTDRIIDIDICVSCDMAFTEPMHCNKPKITSLVEDLATDAGKSGPSFLTDHIKVCHRKKNIYRY